MKLSKINYHLDKAAHFRRLADWDGSGRPGQIDPGPTMMLPAKALKRAEWHEAKAAALLLEGAADYVKKKRAKASRAQNVLDPKN